MNDELIIFLWCQLAFRIDLNKEELKLRDNCAKHILDLIGK